MLFWFPSGGNLLGGRNFLRESLREKVHQAVDLQKNLCHQIRSAMDAVRLDLVRVTDNYKAGDKLVVAVQIEVHPVGNGRAFFPVKMIVEDAEDVACHADVVERGSRGCSHHLAVNQFLPLFSIKFSFCQEGFHQIWWKRAAHAEAGADRGGRI